MHNLRPRRGVAIGIEPSKHRHNRGDPGPGREEYDLPRKWDGEIELARRRGEPDELAGMGRGGELLREQPVRHRLDADRQQPAPLPWDARKRVGAPHEPAVDLQAHSDELSGVEVWIDAGPRPDVDGGESRVPFDGFDTAAEFTPAQRIEERRVVLGKQRGGEDGGDPSQGLSHRDRITPTVKLLECDFPGSFRYLVFALPQKFEKSTRPLQTSGDGCPPALRRFSVRASSPTRTRRRMPRVRRRGTMNSPQPESPDAEPATNTERRAPG